MEVFNKEIEKMCQYKNPPHILLVEDDVITLKVHTRMLQQLNCKIDLAEDGFKALTLYKNKHYDLILMDEEMPGMKGTTVIKEIRKIEANKLHTPIIILTGYSSLEDKQKCIEAGADKVFTKPIYLDELQDIVTFYIN